MDKDIINNADNISTDITPMQYHIAIIVSTLVCIATLVYYIFSGDFISILFSPFCVAYIILAVNLSKIEEHKAIYKQATEYSFTAMFYIVGIFINLTLIPHMQEILLKQPNALRHIFFIIISLAYLSREIIAINLYKKSK